MAKMDLKNANKVSLSQTVETTPANPKTVTKAASSAKATRTGGKQGKQWKRFIELADEYKKNATKDNPGIQVWIDADIKNKLELLRMSGMKYPVRQLLNAGMSVFLEEIEDEYNNQVNNKVAL